MLRPQATRCTQKQLAYLAFWQSRGYRFAWNEEAPENTVTPPSFATRHPIIDALLGTLLLAVFIALMLGAWIKVGAGL